MVLTSDWGARLYLYHIYSIVVHWTSELLEAEIDQLNRKDFETTLMNCPLPVVEEEYIEGMEPL